MNKAKQALALLSCLLAFTHCTKKKEESRQMTELRQRALKQYEKIEALEKTIKDSFSDEGKQNWLRHDLELEKSRLLRVQEEAKQLNGGVEVNLAPPPKPKEGEKEGH